MMHIATLLPLALTLGAVAEKGRLGYALGTKLPSGECKTTADYEADFDALEATSTLVRGYAADDCNFAQQALPAAKSKGFQITLGIWCVSCSAVNLLRASFARRC